MEKWQSLSGRKERKLLNFTVKKSKHTEGQGTPQVKLFKKKQTK